MSVLWQARVAAQAMGGTVGSDYEINGISIDTRTIARGDLFVALKAARDGHDFVEQALNKGATGALVSHIPKGLSEAMISRLIIVDDVLQGLERLALAARNRLKGKLVGVTGSVGKTSSKEMLRDMLSRQGKCHAAEASYNNHWGVPLTLARMPADTDFAIIEIGMNHPGEIAPLAKMAAPHVAMITTVAPAHLAAFKDVDGIAIEKAAICEGLVEGGVSVFHGDLAVSPILQAAWSGKSISFGQHPENTAVLQDVLLENNCTKVTARMKDQPVEFTLSTAGRHFASNALGCLAVVEALGADLNQAAQDLIHWAPPEGRGAREVIRMAEGAFELIDDAFNANPSSMGVALEVLAKSQVSHSGRKIAVLGDMLELGETEISLHSDIALLEWIENIDEIHTVGPLMKHLWNCLPAPKRGHHFETAKAGVDVIKAHIKEHDIVLVKGSKGSRVSLLVASLREIA